MWQEEAPVALFYFPTCRSWSSKFWRGLHPRCRNMSTRAFSGLPDKWHCINQYLPLFDQLKWMINNILETFIIQRWPSPLGTWKIDSNAGLGLFCIPPWRRRAAGKPWNVTFRKPPWSPKWYQNLDQDNIPQLILVRVFALLTVKVHRMNYQTTFLT